METPNSSLNEWLLQKPEMITVGNLGTFSMTAVYEALVNTLSKTSSNSTTPALILPLEDKADDSDCSWTQEEETGDFYTRTRSQLDNFILSPDQTTMTTDELSRHERRFVHATAQVMHLGHASLGPPRSRNRRMVIFKPHRDNGLELEDHSQTVPLLHATSSSLLTTGLQSIAEQERSRTISWADDFDSGSLISSTTSQRKRKRLEKLNNGYPCQFPPCTKLFDRASERNKHEQAHQPAFTNRHTCALCHKGFRYPKDLRRHNARVHENAASRAIFDPTYASFGSMTVSSTLTYESRIPSETSLTFNSQPTSKNNSPMLLGQGNGMAAIEEWSLDDGSELMPGLCLDAESGLPFQELADFDFDQHDLDEEGFLEMAKGANASLASETSPANLFLLESNTSTTTTTVSRHTASKDDSPFSKLPREIRDENWSLALQSDRDCGYSFYYNLTLRTGFKHSKKNRRCLQALAMTTTCKQMRHEIIPLFYNRSSFTVISCSERYDLCDGTKVNSAVPGLVVFRKWIEQTLNPHRASTGGMDIRLAISSDTFTTKDGLILLEEFKNAVVRTMRSCAKRSTWTISFTVKFVPEGGPWISGNIYRIPLIDPGNRITGSIERATSRLLVKYGASFPRYYPGILEMMKVGTGILTFMEDLRRATELPQETLQSAISLASGQYSVESNASSKTRFEEVSYGTK